MYHGLLGCALGALFRVMICSVTLWHAWAFDVEYLQMHSCLKIFPEFVDPANGALNFIWHGVQLLLRRCCHQ
jgi:hypothetical protein